LLDGMGQVQPWMLPPIPGLGTVPVTP
jgi:hypothetical protein